MENLHTLQNQQQQDRSMGNFFESEDPTQLSAAPPPFAQTASATPNNPSAPQGIEGGGSESIDLAAIQLYLQSGKADILYVSSILRRHMKAHPHLIISALDILPYRQTDNLAYNLVASTPSSELQSLPRPVLERLYTELTGNFKTLSPFENGRMAGKVLAAMGTPAKTNASSEGQPTAEQQTQHETPRGMTADLAALRAEWNGTITMENGNVKIWENGDLVKSVSLANMRASLTTQFNWSGIVKLMTDVAASTDALTYTSPTNLQGNDTDNPRIMPDAMLAHLVYLQVEAARAGKKTVSTYITDGAGILGGTQLKDLFNDGDTKVDYMDQRDVPEEEKPEVSSQIFDPAYVQTNPGDVYDIVRDLVLQRNGLFSDEDRITNVVAFRNWDNSWTVDQYGRQRLLANDWFIVLWKVGEQKFANITKCSTDPGVPGVNNRMGSDQTLTLKPGWHQQYQAAGRTSQHLWENPSGNLTYNSTDGAGMNVHKANSNHMLQWDRKFADTGKAKRAQVHSNSLDSDTEKAIYRDVLALQRAIVNQDVQGVNNWDQLVALAPTNSDALQLKSQIDTLLDNLSTNFSNYQMTPVLASGQTLTSEDFFNEVIEKVWVKGTKVSPYYHGVLWKDDANPNLGFDPQFSIACQVVPSTKDFSNFMHSWQQFAFSEDDSEQTEQEKWYYSIINCSTLLITNP